MVVVTIASLTLLVSVCDRADDTRPPGSDHEETPEPSVEISALDSIIAIGEAAYWEGDFAEARARWTTALDHALDTGDRALEAEILTWLGLVAYRLGEYEVAREIGEKALSIKIDLDLESELSRSYNALGLLAWNQGLLEEAAERLNDAFLTAREVEDREGVAKATHNLGLVYVELGEFERARESFEESRTAGREIGHVRLQGASANNLGMLAVKLGNPGEAIALLREARQLYRSIDYATGEQNTLGQLAVAYAELGQPTLAFAALDTAQSMARDQGLQQEVASNLELFGELYRDSGDLRRALEHFDRASALNEELDLRVEQGTNLRSEADIYAAFGELDRARALAARALEIHQQAGARLEEGWDHLLLAELLARLDAKTGADRHIAQARKISVEVSAPPLRIGVALTEARLADLMRDFGKVLGTLREIDEDLERGGYRESWEAERLRARAYAGLGRPDSAAAAGRRAIRALERVRGNYGSPALRTAFVADQASVYEELVESLLRLGEIEEAFEVAEAVRGRALIEHLAVLERSNRWNGGAIRALAEGEERLREIEAIAETLSEAQWVPLEDRTAADERTIDYLAKRLEQARSAYETMRTSVAQAHPEAVSLIGGGSIGSYRVRASLSADEVLIEYLVTPESVLLFVVRSGGIRTLQSTIPRIDLESRVRLARDLILTPNVAPRELDEILAELHGLLLGPVVRSGVLRGTDRILFVPHGALSYLPFSALRDRVTGRYLVEDYEIAVLPSASALSVLRMDEARDGSVSHEIEGPVVFAPFPGRLPATDREAKAVRRALPGARVQRGGDATEAALVQALRRSELVHVATHGVLNRNNPLFSRIELAPADGDAGEDGWLEVHEIITERLESRLVFLSGCETGLGSAWSTKFAAGEDYATLAKAFLYAGAENVIATLWRIEDRGASVFAERFYHHLRDIGPVAGLAAAQREMIADASYSAPFYWAGYQLNGVGWRSVTAKTVRASVRQN